MNADFVLVNWYGLELPEYTMQYRINIDKRNCQGHARCANRAPHLFELNSDGYIASEGFDVPPGEEANALAGALSCPERVIAMVDSEGNQIRRLPQTTKVA
jgi:ferredoxin